MPLSPGSTIWRGKFRSNFRFANVSAFTALALTRISCSVATNPRIATHQPRLNNRIRLRVNSSFFALAANRSNGFAYRIARNLADVAVSLRETRAMQECPLNSCSHPGRDETVQIMAILLLKKLCRLRACQRASRFTRCAQDAHRRGGIV